MGDGAEIVCGPTSGIDGGGKLIVVSPQRGAFVLRPGAVGTQDGAGIDDEGQLLLYSGPSEGIQCRCLFLEGAPTASDEWVGARGLAPRGAEG